MKGTMHGGFQEMGNGLLCAKPELSKKTKKAKAEHPTAKAFAELMAETKAIMHDPERNQGDVIVGTRSASDEHPISIRWRQVEDRWRYVGNSDKPLERENK